MNYILYILYTHCTTSNWCFWSDGISRCLLVTSRWCSFQFKPINARRANWRVLHSPMSLAIENHLFLFFSIPKTHTHKRKKNTHAKTNKQTMANRNYVTSVMISVPFSPHPPRFERQVKKLYILARERASSTRAFTWLRKERENKKKLLYVAIARLYTCVTLRQQCEPNAIIVFSLYPSELSRSARVFSLIRLTQLFFSFLLFVVFFYNYIIFFSQYLCAGI